METIGRGRGNGEETAENALRKLIKIFGINSV